MSFEDWYRQDRLPHIFCAGCGIPGPQSISIVGQMLVISRGTTTTRIDTPGTRIAVVSNFKFQETPAGTVLK